MPDKAVAARLPHKRFALADALILAAALSSLLFIWLIAVPAFAPESMLRHAPHAPMRQVHMVGGIVMLLSGCVALRIGITRRWFGWHRRAGLTYLAAGTLAAGTALIRSFDVPHTPGWSTGVLAAVWLVFSAMAYRAVRNRRIDQHREWMIRSYVVAWTFVFCRFWSRALPDGLQGSSQTDMIWMTWIVPVLIAEIALQWQRGAAVPARAAPGPVDI